MSQQFDPGGLVPSKGLALPQAERVFQEAGTYPVIVARELNKPNDVSFYRQLTAYVDSGFPLFAAMHNRGHAMAVVGYEWRTPLNTGLAGMRYSWDEIKALAVVDDNHLPYLSIPADGGHTPQRTSIRLLWHFQKRFFILPMRSTRWCQSYSGLVKWCSYRHRIQTIIRYFVTTGSAFRSFVRSHESEFDPQLLAAVMKLPFAQFFWIVEFATETQWAINQISARAVIDATASHTEHYPYWVLHGRKEALIFWRDSVSLDLQNGHGRPDDGRHGTCGIFAHGHELASDADKMRIVIRGVSTEHQWEQMEEHMDKNKTGLFKLVEGLKPVDASALEEYEREMTDEAIPEIIKDVEKRRMLAAESRQRRLEMPRSDKPEPK